MGKIKEGDIIAVDFDGTLCENAWPGIGSQYKELIDFLIRCKKDGAQLILWTMREGELLHKALVWCTARGLEFDAVNDNVQKMKDFYGNNPRKVFANYYFDDHNAALVIDGKSMEILNTDMADAILEDDEGDD